MCLDEDDPEHIFLYEIYDDRAAFERHLASDHFKSFDRVSAPLLSAKAVEIRTLQNLPEE